jgi:MFS family permease
MTPAPGPRRRRTSLVTVTDAMAPQTTGRRAPGPMSPAHRLVTISLVSLVTIIAFEAMAISTAMPIIARDLDAVRSYGLAFSAMLTTQLLGIVLAGVWCDRRGPLPSLFAGQALMAAGTALAGLAPTFPVLLAGRLVAGLGAGLLTVAIYVVIGRAYPETLRPRVFSWISAAWVLPSLVGPPVAGWLAETFSWRWVFLVVVVPVAVTMVVVAIRHETMRDDSDSELSPTPVAEQRRLVVLGLVVAVAAGAMQWGAESLVPVRVLPLVATVAGLAGVLVASPRLVPRGTLRMARGLPSVMLCRFLLTASFNGAMTFVPLMLILSRGLGATVAGAMLTVGAVGWSAGSWVQGQHRFAGLRSSLVSVGGASLALGVAALAAIAGFGLPYGLVGVAAALCGTGMGLAMSSTSVLSLSLSPVVEHGRTSSSLQLADVLGSVMGIAAAGSVFAALHDGVRSDIPTFVLMWLVLAAIAAVVVPGGQRTRT